jgi:hypothetical protein
VTALRLLFAAAVWVTFLAGYPSFAILAVMIWVWMAPGVTGVTR